MNSRSEEKILCPYCGEEMQFEALVGWAHLTPAGAGYHWHQCGECPNCGANSPEGYGRTLEEAKEAARAAALRRYTPPAKPLSLAEARERNNKDLPIYVECRFSELWHGVPPVNGWVVGFGWLRSWVEPDAEPVGYIEKGYGCYWRCWERKPTDEERSAAEWET